MREELMAALEHRAVDINGVGVIGLVMIFLIVTAIVGLLLLREDFRRRA